MGQAQRATYKYIYKVGSRIRHFGTTADLSRRGREHKKIWSAGHIRQVGRRTTRTAARKWVRGKR